MPFGAPVGAPRQAPPPAALASQASDEGFVLLQNAFRPWGGLATGDEVAQRLHATGDGGGYAGLARWIVGRRVFSFSWHQSIWLPLFQFDLQDGTLRDGLQPVLSELMDVMDGWTLAVWFVLPNSALDGGSPLALLDSDRAEVFQAARLQRFVMRA